MSIMGCNIKSVKVSMLMALLFCVFLCPNNSSAFQDDCSASESVVACEDLCESPCPSPEDGGCFESCVYDLRDEASFTVCWSVVHVDWDYIALLFNKPEHTVCYSDPMTRSSHSFAIRHLDSIILRV